MTSTSASKRRWGRSRRAPRSSKGEGSRRCPRAAARLWERASTGASRRGSSTRGARKARPLGARRTLAPRARVCCPLPTFDANAVYAIDATALVPGGRRCRRRAPAVRRTGGRRSAAVRVAARRVSAGLRPGSAADVAATGAHSARVRAVPLLGWPAPLPAARRGRRGGHSPAARSQALRAAKSGGSARASAIVWRSVVRLRRALVPQCRVRGVAPTPSRQSSDSARPPAVRSRRAGRRADAAARDAASADVEGGDGLGGDLRRAQRRAVRQLIDNERIRELRRLDARAAGGGQDPSLRVKLPRRPPERPRGPRRRCELLSHGVCRPRSKWTMPPPSL